MTLQSFSINLHTWKIVLLNCMTFNDRGTPGLLNCGWQSCDRIASNTVKNDTVKKSSSHSQHRQDSTAAERRLLADRSARIDLDVACIGRCRSSRADSRLYLGGHRDESLLDVCCILCTCLQEWNAQLICIFLQLSMHLMCSLTHYILQQFIYSSRRQWETSSTATTMAQ